MRRHHHNTRQRRRKWTSWLPVLLLLLTPASLRAQEGTSLMIDVNPTQDILPPQVGDYKANPAKYFTVSIINQTGEDIQAYLAVQIEQLFDNDNHPQTLSLSSPATRMPSSPIVVPAHGTVDLSMEQMRRIFDHIPLSEMHFSEDVFKNFGSSAFGLLPEGLYRIRLTAYKWDPLRRNMTTGLVDDPVALSNADITGFSPFRICYRAQAPVFLTPTPQSNMGEPNSTEVVRFPLQNPVFTWTEPTMNCWRDVTPMYQYTLYVYEQLITPNLVQSPEEATRNPYKFRVQGISSPQCILNYSAIQKLLDGHTYVAQVIAEPRGMSDMNFAMVENDGKSPLLVFTPDLNGFSDQQDWDEEEEEEEEEEDEFDLSLLGMSTEIGESDSLYVFRNPEVYKPDFDGNTNRTLFAGNTLNSAWHRPLFAGGLGEQQDTLKFRYRAELYALSGYATKEEALEHEPLYSGIVKGAKKTEGSASSDSGKSDNSTQSNDAGNTNKPKNGSGGSGESGETSPAAELEQVQQQLGEIRELKALLEKEQSITSGSGNTGGSATDSSTGKPKKGANSFSSFTDTGNTRSSLDFGNTMSAVERDRLNKLKQKYNITTIAQCDAKIAELEPKEKTLKAQAGVSGPSDSDGVDVLEDYIPWNDLAGKVSVGQALLLRIVPECVNQTSVRFFGDVNEWALQYSDKLSEAFGNECGEAVIEENRVPIDISENDMKGKVVHVGEYTMKMNDDMKLDSKTKSWSGTAFLEWRMKYPKEAPINVGVRFENIYINSDYIMYEGVVKSDPKSNWAHIKERAKELGLEYTDPSQLSEWVPDDLFTEWGLDNLVGYITPDAMLPYMQEDINQMESGINSLAKKINASKYYDYIRRGWAGCKNLWNNGIGSTDAAPEVFLPLNISDLYKDTPVDIQILSMEFHPTSATMNLLGMFSMGDNDITDEDILIFGAPSICMDPDRLLPGTGYISLLSDVTLNDPNSDFSWTFKAPKDMKKPEDGCYVMWDTDTLSSFCLHAEMAIPNLLKCNDQGEVLPGDQCPKFTMKAWVKDWDDWTAGISMDPFTHKDVKGWVFTAQEAIYDHSKTRNDPAMTFPKKTSASSGKGDNEDDPEDHTIYNLEEAGIEGNNLATWQGFYLRKLEVRAPAYFLSNSGTAIAAENMLIDDSGVTMTLDVNDAIDVDYDGWEMHLKHIFFNIIQNNFGDCGFSGDMHVPLMNENLDFTCNIYPVTREDNSTEFDCVLKVDEDDKLKNIRFDFILAELTLTNKQSYFLLESRAGRTSSEERKTRVELCLAGDITIGGTAKYNDWLNEKMKNLPMKINIPGLHFTQMRLANCERWLSDAKLPGGKEIREMQEAATNKANDSKANVYTWYTFNEGKNKEIWLGDKCVFETGIWSVASYEKTIGPFHFGIMDYKVSKVDADKVGFGITGRLALLDKPGTNTLSNDDVAKNALICCDLSLWIDCDVDIKNLDLTYNETRFEEIQLNANFCGVSFFGALRVGEDEKTKSKGYGGNIKIKLPGDLIEFEADGGFYEHEATEEEGAYKWGYFYLGVGGKMGVEITPLKITKLGAGVFINCYAEGEDKTKVKPQKGLIGVMADLGLSSSDGQVIKGDFHMSVLYDNKHDRLTSFLFTGHATAVADMIDSKVTIKWESNDQDKYFELDVTVDVKADAGTMLNSLGEQIGADEIMADFKRINDKWEEYAGVVTGNPGNKIGDNSGATAGHKTNANTKDAEEAESNVPKASMGGHVALNFKLTFRKDGVNYPKVKWHIYLGEPDPEKRCRFTLIDFKSKIVTVNIGNDFYVCVGNELPNNGELPPIPKKITDFLDGSSKGGVEGASTEKANNARKKALRAFSKDAEIDGGVMGGASVWGYVDFDLGLFYGDMGAVAGFDVSIARLKYNDCPGEPDGTMGYKNWYAEGQLYAYLYAKFGIHVDLGFWDKKIDIIDAGIGGVVRCGLPSPSYFVGDFRVKLNLLNGLVKINRRFQFECGHVCHTFYGNPLDNFEMFGTSSIGSSYHKEGWATDAELVSPYIATKPYYETQVPIGQHFRVLDENTLHDLAENYNGEMEELEMQSKRTFVFKQINEVKLYEFYETPSYLLNSLDSSATDRNIQLLESNTRKRVYTLTRKDEGQTRFRLDDIKQYLQPDHYYAIVVKGTAKEIVCGQESPVREWSTTEHRYIYRDDWTQNQIYYFRTGTGTPDVNDVADLEPYVALAFPSIEGRITDHITEEVLEKYNDFAKEVTDSSTFIKVYMSDAQHPTIALNQQLFFFDGDNNSIVKEGYPFQKHPLMWVYRKLGNNKIAGPDRYYCNHMSNSQNIGATFQYKDIGIKGTLGLLYPYYEYTYTEHADTTYQTVTPNPSSSAFGFGSQSNGLQGSGSLPPPPGLNPNFNANNASVLGVFSTSLNSSVSQIQTESNSSSGNVQSGLRPMGSGSGNSGNSNSSSTTSATIAGAFGSNLQTIDVNNSTEPEPETRMVIEHYTTKDSVLRYKVLMQLNIHVVNGDWLSGYYDGIEEHGHQHLPYSKPYVGMKLDEITYDYNWENNKHNNTQTIESSFSERLYNPYLYMSYLANYFYIGGHGITNYGFEYLEDREGYSVPVAESLIYYTKAGQTSGNFNNDDIYSIFNGQKAFRSLSVNLHDTEERQSFGEYPLPEYKDTGWATLVRGNPRTPYPIADNYGKADQKKNLVKNFLGDIAAPYYLAEKLSKVWDQAGKYPEWHKMSWYWGAWPWLYPNNTEDGLAKYRYTHYGSFCTMFQTGNVEAALQGIMIRFNDFHRGMYKTVNYSRPNGIGEERDTISAAIPYYQFPVVYGATLPADFNNPKIFKCALIKSMPSVSNERQNRQRSGYMLYRMTGGFSAKLAPNDLDANHPRGWLYDQEWSTTVRDTYSNIYYTKEHFDAKAALKHITKVKFTIYRVNAYDYNNGQLYYNSDIPSALNIQTVDISNPFSNWVNDGE